MATFEIGTPVSKSAAEVISDDAIALYDAIKSLGEGLKLPVVFQGAYETLAEDGRAGVNSEFVKLLKELRSLAEADGFTIRKSVSPEGDTYTATFHTTPKIRRPRAAKADA